MRYWIALVWVVWPSAIVAEDLVSFDTGEDLRGWEAVGRLDLAGQGYCTGTLISDDVVLTAAHCVYDKKTNTQIDPKSITFHAGYRNGHATAQRIVRDVFTHPQYDFDGAPGAERVSNDVALLQLHHPIHKTSIRPFPTDMNPKAGDSVGVLSYGKGRDSAPSLEQACGVLSRQDGVIVMDCDVEFGSSGSPVFSFDRYGSPHIVSVVSAKATSNGQKISLGTSLARPLRDLKAAVARNKGIGASVDVIRAGERRATGAKFVKP